MINNVKDMLQKERPKRGLRLMVWLSCLASLLPYIFLYASPYPYRWSVLPVLLMPALAGSIIWLLLVIITLAYGRWERKLFRLFAALFPVAFGPWFLLIYYFVRV